MSIAHDTKVNNRIAPDTRKHPHLAVVSAVEMVVRHVTIIVAKSLIRDSLSRPALVPVRHHFDPNIPRRPGTVKHIVPIFLKTGEIGDSEIPETAFLAIISFLMRRSGPVFWGKCVDKTARIW